MYVVTVLLHLTLSRNAILYVFFSFYLSVLFPASSFSFFISFSYFLLFIFLSYLSFPISPPPYDSFGFFISLFLFFLFLFPNFLISMTKDFLSYFLHFLLCLFPSVYLLFLISFFPLFHIHSFGLSVLVFSSPPFY
jgi:hypothetical protein